MRKKKSVKKHENDFVVSDGSRSHGEYGTDEYGNFISNGMTNNEKIDAVEYFEEFLDEKP